MPRDRSPVELVAELHRRQGAMYSGGSIDAVAELLAEDVVWHVPGRSSIAGDHRGTRQVVDYFERRRRLANATILMHPGELDLRAVGCRGKRGEIAYCL